MNLKNKIGIGLVVLGVSGFVYGSNDAISGVNRSNALNDQYKIRRVNNIERISKNFPEVKECKAVEAEYNQLTSVPGFENARQEYNDLGEITLEFAGGIAVSGVLCIAGTVLGIARKEDAVKEDRGSK